MSEEKYIAEAFSKLIEQNTNFIFTKFGDGEYACMNFHPGKNCDNDTYTQWLGSYLIDSFKHLSTKENVFLGKWHDNNMVEFFNRISPIQKVNWVHYHSVMNASPVDGGDYFDSFSNKALFNLVKSIRNSDRKKIIVSNVNNKKLKDIFNADVFIEVSSQNWSSNYESYENNVLAEIEDSCILITAAGMCSKVLISNMSKKNENITCIDLGSGFDLLATGVKSRPWRHSYADELEYYQDLFKLV